MAATLPTRRLSAAFPIVLAAMLAAGACTNAPPPISAAALRDEVASTERAFAKTMADRDHAAFASFLADEAVFFSGEKALRGRTMIAEKWKRFYEGPTAPFSWEPETVEVLASGGLALTSGPVREPDGTVVGRFNSVWRREAPGRWRIVFDKGCDVCPLKP